MNDIIKVTFLLFLLVFLSVSYAQEPIVLDKIISVVGDEIVTKSELETQVISLAANNIKLTDNTRCEVLEDLLYSKVLLNQAKLDSVEVSDAQVESEMDRRMRYYINMVGSEQALETQYNKSIAKIKEEMRESMRDQMLVQAMQGKIAADISVTPEEVQNYFDNIPKDSLPLIDAEVEIAQIVAHAPISNEAIEEVKEKLRTYRKRVLDGESFATLAILYSEDKGSAVKGGEIGFVGKAEVEPEFSAAAFKLKPGGVSTIVKTRFGYHIIEMIERRANKVNVRHILLKPKYDEGSYEKVKAKLDSIANLIAIDSITFETAAKRFSDDEETKLNGGMMVNPYTTASLIPMADLDPQLFMVIDKMKVGEVSNAVRMDQDPRKKPGYRLIKLKRRTEPHRANMKDDYQKIKAAATAEKEQELLQEWIKETLLKTYVTIDKEYREGCVFQQNWMEQK